MPKSSKSREKKIYAWSNGRGPGQDWSWVRRILENKPQPPKLATPAEADVVWAFVSNGTLPEEGRVELLQLIGRGVPILWFALSKDKLTATPLPHCPTDCIPQRIDLMPPEAFASEVTSKFAAMAKKLLAGSSYDELESSLDELLGTEAPEARNFVIEAEWETSYREGQQ